MIRLVDRRHIRSTAENCATPLLRPAKAALTHGAPDPEQTKVPAGGINERAKLYHDESRGENDAGQRHYPPTQWPTDMPVPKQSTNSKCRTLPLADHRHLHACRQVLADIIQCLSCAIGANRYFAHAEALSLWRETFRLSKADQIVLPRLAARHGALPSSLGVEPENWCMLDEGTCPASATPTVS